MVEHEQIESKEFRAPFVRVRGRVSRAGEVQWSPCLRTEKGPPDAVVRNNSSKDLIDKPAVAVVVREDRFTVDFLDYLGTVLRSGHTEPRFFAKDQEWATFVARLPYHEQTQTVRLRFGERELGLLHVPTDRPYFTLLHPGEDSYIDGSGILHLHWCGHDSEHPMTFFVRYSHNDHDWLRPGVNLRTNDYYLDLREMPGGERCVVEVIATNGYRTSYAQTRHFGVPIKPPEILLGEATGPVLFAQGFSREHGPIVGDDIIWLVDDGEVAHRGGTLDVRTLTAGVHRVSVRVHDPEGQQRVELVGTYDSETGLLIGPAAL